MQSLRQRTNMMKISLLKYCPNGNKLKITKHTTTMQSQITIIKNNHTGM